MDKTKKFSMLVENFENLDGKTATKIAEYIVNEAGIGNINNLLDTRLEYFVHEDLILVSWTYFTTKLSYVGWDDPTYCTIQKVPHSNKVIDYHNRNVVIFKMVNNGINVIGKNSERKLFRTTDDGVMSKHFSCEILEVKIEKNLKLNFADDTAFEAVI